MNQIKAIITLIRLPNLIFIFLTQILAYSTIVLPAILKLNAAPTLSSFKIVLLAFSTTLIASAGYIINDYFDIGIDAINKPGKVTIEKIFKRRTVIAWHITLNVIALALTLYIIFYTLPLRLISIQIISILLLLFYSTTFKRKLVIGNITIALLTSLTLITAALYEPKFKLLQPNFMHAKLLWMYILFAFIITLIREIVKDIEDVKGDTVQHCKTIPLVWGIAKAKYILYTLVALLLVLQMVFLIYYSQSNLILVTFLFGAVFAPTLFVINKLQKASNSIHFHHISTYVKWITFLGILSMILI